MPLDDSNSPSHDDNVFPSDYLIQAEKACFDGDIALGIHLYLAAFELSQSVSDDGPDQSTIEGLKLAWNWAYTVKERSLAECIFDRLEPYLSSGETMLYVEQLQDLSLDKLGEFGFSKEDLEDMSNLISQDLLGLGGASSLKLEHVMTPPKKPSSCSCSHSDSCGPTPEAGTASLSSLNADGKTPQDISELIADRIPGVVALGVGNLKSQEKTQPADKITYDNLVGYDTVKAHMREFGIGRQHDLEFQAFIKELNKRHGLERMPASDVLLFRSQAREDANYFLNATIGELNLPVLRMRMEETSQGVPVLNVMAQANRQPKLNAAKNGFESAGILLLEDLDLWVSPVSDALSDDVNAPTQVTLSRGAREAITLIRSAVENPDVYVLASVSNEGEIAAFFYDLLEPLAVVEIECPTASERAAIWQEIIQNHPSLMGLDQVALVRLSGQMPRYDMYMAAREAVEDSYRTSLAKGQYCAVSLQNVLEKLAAYQPLESNEYHALEDAVIGDFRKELENIENILSEDG